MSELKKCPFCGGEADIEEIPGSPFTNEPYTWAVGCKACNIGWYEETQAEATSKWNRRAQPENEPIVRCGECERRVKSADLTDSVLCRYLGEHQMRKTDYCSHGVRKPERSEG